LTVWRTHPPWRPRPTAQTRAPGSAVAALRRPLEQLEALQVDNAREHGWSWQEIAEILGVSRQAVHKKHARRARVH
jgi:DNA-directed RNA polymerase specialized sigma24 family protein